VAKGKIDASVVAAVKNEVEALVKKHGYDVVQRAFNSHLGAIRKVRQLERQKAEIDQDLSKRRAEIDRELAKVNKRLK
jgi:S-adenosylmethionine synthetase